SMIVKRGLTVKRRPDAGSILNQSPQRLWAEDLALQAQEEERQQIADAIHDHSIQTVTAASLRLQQFRRRLHEPRQPALLTALELHEHEGGWLAVVRHEGGEGAPESSGTGPAWARANLRAQLNGGWTRFEAPPEGGVRITCWIPELAGQAGDAAMGREAA